MPRCKTCKQKFEPKQFNQKNCFDNEACIKAEIQRKIKAKDKAWRKERKVRREALKTRGDYLKELQTVFNAWVRERDKGKDCISCGKKAKKENAGHYRSVGGNPELRFNELNCWLQCEYCNTYLHGNLIEYRKALIKLIGVDKVEWLEGPHDPLKLTIPELILMKEEYKEKLRKLKKK